MGKFQHAFKSLRIKEGLTQEEIAYKIGVTRSAVGNWEQGMREPDIETLEVIADYFNVDMNVLTGNTDDNYIEDLKSKQVAQLICDNNELMMLFEVVKDLSKERLVAIINFVNSMK